MSLRIEAVSAGYNGTSVLRDVSLVVPAGRVAALLGPNGAGKTTLLRVCGGFLAPTSGRLSLDGVPLAPGATHRLASLGVCYVTEGRAVFPSLTVAENLRLMGDGSRRDHHEPAIGAFPVLGRKLGQIAGTMSGGEQQMLALARAYLTNPSYLLLDEVSMGLAPIVVDEIFESLAALSAQGVALLIVEQYAAKALALADFVYVLQKGSVAFAGEPSELDIDQLAASYLESTSVGDVVAT